MWIRLFKIGTKFDKHASQYSNVISKGGYFSILCTKTAVARKIMHSPLFSKESVRRSEHLIMDKIAKFLDIMSDYSSAAKPVDLRMGYRCLAADVAMNYVFQRTFDALDAEDFQSELLTGADLFLGMFRWPIYFPNFFGGLMRVTTSLPEWCISRCMTSLSSMIWCFKASPLPLSPNYITIGSVAHDGKDMSRAN